MASCRPVNHERFYSTAAKRWEMDPIRSTVALWYADPERIINMAGGLPATAAMPFKSMDVTMKDGTKFKLEGPSMDSACQYGPTSGSPETVKLFRDLILRLHNPPTAATPSKQGGLEVMVTTGSTEGGSRSGYAHHGSVPSTQLQGHHHGVPNTMILRTPQDITLSFAYMTMELLLNTGDYLLVEDPIWSSTLQSAKGFGLKVLGVKTDHQGIIPASLRQLLSCWSPEDAFNPNSDIPRLLITTPHGSNPTGSTASLERRKEIYQICREYDIIILEDDPYYFLVYDHEPLPSYLSMDVDGRVIRLDSFSKVIAPGFRCGIISGAEPFLRKIMYNLSAAQSHPNTIAQALYQHLFQEWGFDGLMRQTKSNCALYKERRDLVVAAVNKYLKGLVEFDTPAGGMFLWMKIPGLKDTKDMIDKKAPEKGVLVLPGSYFRAGAEESPYIRVSFANPTPEDLDKGFQRLSEMIKEALEDAKDK